MRSFFLGALCLTATVSLGAADGPASDTTGVMPSSLLEGFESNQDLSSWLSFWRLYVPQLRLESFQSVGSRAFPEVNVHIIDYANDMPILRRQDRRGLLAFSPDSSLALDLYTFAIAVSGDSLIYAPDPDSYLYLVNWKTGLGRRVLSCGTPCWYQTTAWIDDHRFVVGGTVEAGSRGESLRLIVYVFDLRSNALTLLYGPELDRLAKAKYWNAWAEILEARFPQVSWRPYH